MMRQFALADFIPPPPPTKAKSAMPKQTNTDHAGTDEQAALSQLLTCWLERLVALQRRAYERNPLKSKKRVVCGAKEVRRKMQFGNVTALVLATDINQPMDEAVMHLVTLAYAKQMPVVHTLSRKALSRALAVHRGARVSICAVMDINGTEDQYRSVLDCVCKQRLKASRRIDAEGRWSLWSLCRRGEFDRSLIEHSIRQGAEIVAAHPSDGTTCVSVAVAAGWLHLTAWLLGLDYPSRDGMKSLTEEELAHTCLPACMLPPAAQLLFLPSDANHVQQQSNEQDQESTTHTGTLFHVMVRHNPSLVMFELLLAACKTHQLDVKAMLQQRDSKKETPLDCLKQSVQDPKLLESFRSILSIELALSL